MITLKAPVELKTVRNILSLTGEQFAERIAGNYSLMKANISQEDLLHVMTLPPEYQFLSEGGIHLENQQNLKSVQENKIQIVNQLINRMAVTANGHFSYQDQVYITSVLRKIGITDVSTFIEQIHNIKEESENTSQLISLYWNNLTSLQNIVKKYQTQENNSLQENKTQQTESTLFLHEEIMNRLQTAAIYQTLLNFEEYDGGNQTYLTSQKLNMMEYQRVTQHVLLNKLENTVRNEEQPLTFHMDYFYENMPADETNITEESISKRLTAAVLVKIIDNVYQSIRENKAINQGQWLHIEQAMYQSAENTVSRLQANYTNHIQQQMESTNLTQNLNQNFKQEIELINRVLQIEEEGNQQIDNKLLTENYHQLIRHENRNSETNNSSQTVEEQSLQFVQENVTEENRIQSQQEMNIKQIQQDLQQIERVNIENRNKYLQALQKIEEKKNSVPQLDRNQQMRRESLKALENPSELLSGYRDEKAEQEEEHEKNQEALMEALPADTRRIFQAVEQYLKAPDQQPDGVVVTRNDMGQFLQDIERVETIKNSQNEEVITQQKNVREVTENVMDKWHKAATEFKPKSINETDETQVSMVHKSMDHQMNEEEVQQLIEENRIRNQQDKVTEQTVVNQEQKVTNLIEQTNHQIYQKNQDITEMVEQGVQRQIETISEQVLNKMEKKLNNERKRRGF